jgi:hypothetical protein
MIIVIIVYCGLNFVVQSIIQPRFIGDAVGLSITVTFVALVFWAWLLGPLGAILAIPLTLLAKSMLVDVDPQARWADALLRASAKEPDPEAPKPRRRRPSSVSPAAAPTTAPPDHLDPRDILGHPMEVATPADTAPRLLDQIAASNVERSAPCRTWRSAGPSPSPAVRPRAGSPRWPKHWPMAAVSRWNWARAG